MRYFVILIVALLLTLLLNNWLPLIIGFVVAVGVAWAEEAGEAR